MIGVLAKAPPMEPFKNVFSPPAARRIAHALERSCPTFSRKRFLHRLDEALAPLELKPRMELLADRIEAQLPTAPPDAFEYLIASLAVDDDDAIGLRGFLVWPLTEMVARRGLPHFEASMIALREMTKRFTAEYAIRPFMLNEQERTLRQMHAWINDPNEHVRRLVSEGSRPLLPWGARLPAVRADPDLTLPLLEALRSDPSEYVRRSVANHLNDHTKAHPDRIVAVLRHWLALSPEDRQLTRLVRHASRTLLKDGHQEALALHGFAHPDTIELLACTIAHNQLRVGETLTYGFTLRNVSSAPAKVLFDYAIHHRKANGSLSAKVFKGCTRTLSPGEHWNHTGRHRIRKVTTRRYYAGFHHFEPRINGQRGTPLSFELLLD